MAKVISFASILFFLATLPSCSTTPTAFEASFFTDLQSLAPDSSCADPHSILNTQSGSGQSPQIGGFTTLITFCVDPNTLEYIDGKGSFVSEDGDELHFTIDGKVLPSEAEGYDLEFKDPFVITGGTGRFQGATGSGTTDSYVNMSTNRTDHKWTGSIALK